MNLGQFRTNAARVVGMSTSLTADTALIDAWANEAVVQFLKETKLNVLPLTVSMTAGTADITLSTDIIAMQAIWYAPADSSESMLLQAVAPETMYELRIPDVDDNPTVRYYALSGAHVLLLHPAPQSSSDVLHLLYVPRPTAMSSTADSPSQTARGNIPEEYHPILEEYVLWKAARAEEHKGSDNGLQFQAGWERGVSKVRAELQRKAGMVLPAVRLGRPARRLPRSPGVDLGV